jgi:phenylalanyl-tRNA synthetase beta chain
MSQQLPPPDPAAMLPRIRQVALGRPFAWLAAGWRDLLANPIASQMSVLRSTLIGGLVANVATNLKRRQTRIRLFETGSCFYRDERGQPVPGFAQPWRLTALAYGPALPEQWASATINSDFFDLKGDLERLLAPKVARFERIAHPALHPGRSAQIIVDECVVGIMGELHPQWQQK